MSWPENNAQVSKITDNNFENIMPPLGYILPPSCQPLRLVIIQLFKFAQMECQLNNEDGA